MIFRLKSIYFLVFLCLGLVSCQVMKKAKPGFVYAKEGRLYFPDGKELALWGVNLQPCLSWEYNSLFELIGVPLNADTLKLATDDALDEIQKMNCDMIRCHLTPSDFTDSEGNLVETIYLDLLDYMIAAAAKRSMYVYITFLNSDMGFDIDVDDPLAHTPNFVEGSFGGNINRKHLIENEEVVEKSKKYITQLLNRINPYTRKSYKGSSEIVVWEIINEPIYFSYKEIAETPYYADYKGWLADKNMEDSKESYASYRHDLVLNYINNMYDVIRETGAVQPIVWNCNWDRMIVGNEEVFDAIGASKVEVVSFCHYPGQSLLKRPYTKNPEDLSRHDFTSYLQQSYNNKNYYGWVLSEGFKDKAKVVYEFETFYNYSKYLYPAQVDFFRAMGAQMASMWHYSMPRYAPYRNGSHHLSLTSTPGKAAAYTVAGQLFRNLPLYHEYDMASPVEKQTSDYMYSYERDLSAYSSSDFYIHAGDMTGDGGLQPKPGVKKVIGFGSSPLVNYEGNGIYTIDISENEINIEIQPNTEQLKPLWGKDFLVSLVTKLDYSTEKHFQLKLDGWAATNSEVFRISNAGQQKLELSGQEGVSFMATPGSYIVKKAAR